MDGNFERLKLVSHKKDRGDKVVPVPRRNMDIRISECVCPISFQFDNKEVLRGWKWFVSRK